MNYMMRLRYCRPSISFGVSEAQEKWTKLFNGKDLTGWKPLNGKAKYEVKNGEIIGTTVFKEPNSFMVTKQLMVILSLSWNINLMRT
jgi:hypothetical protein